MSESLIRGVARAIERFEAGELDVGGLQDRFESALDALDHTYPDVVRELEQVVPDLEEIRFAVSENDRRPAASRRISAVKSAVGSVLEASDGRN
jgi:hypothetical protein